MLESAVLAGSSAAQSGRTKEASVVIQTVRLYYPQSLVHEPVINQLIRQHEITVNIMEAKIGLEEGWLQVQISGTEAEIQRAVEWLKAQGIDVRPAGEKG
jgi:ABC-type methionine transport system ATPase subunit